MADETAPAQPADSSAPAAAPETNPAPAPESTPAASTNPPAEDGTPTEGTPESGETRHHRTVAEQLDDAKKELADLQKQKSDLETAHRQTLDQLKQEQAQRMELDNVKQQLAELKQQLADTKKAHAEEIRKAKATAYAEAGMTAPVSTQPDTAAGMTLEKLATMSATEVSKWKADHPTAFKRLTQPNS